MPGSPILNEKIAIVGCGGAGKSTLACYLGERLGLPVYHLDAELWKPGWVMTEREEEIKIIKRLAQSEAWIIDGNYGYTMPDRLKVCDAVIVLDFPTYLCLWRVVKRCWRYRGKVRPDMGEGCLEKIDVEFLRWIWGYRKKQRPRVFGYIEEHGKACRVIVLNGPREVKSFVKQMEY